MDRVLELLKLLLCLLIEIINYVLCYRVIFQSEINKDLKKWILTVSGIIGTHCLFIPFHWENKMDIFTMITIPLFLIDENKKRNCILYPFCVAVIHSLSYSVSFITVFLIGIPQTMLINHWICNLLFQSMPAFIFFIVFMIIKAKKIEPVQLMFNKIQYTLYYISAAAILMLMSVTQTLEELDVKNYFYNLYGFASVIVSILLIVLLFWQSIAVQQQILLKKRNDFYEEYIKNLELYINQLIVRDKNLRCFRHDMNNHLSVLKAYCETNQMQKALNYLDYVFEKITINKIQHFTGYLAIDTILTQMSVYAEQKCVHLIITSRYDDASKVDAYDLVSILSNLLTISIQACEKVPEQNERQIIFDLQNYNENVYIKVKNTINDEFQNHAWSSLKKLSKNLSIEMQNIIYIVKQYNGIYTYKTIEKNKIQWFCVAIEL